MQFIQTIQTQLAAFAKNAPEGFYGSFDYTSTGNNLSHPVTIGLLSKILWAFPQTHWVAIDVHLNAGDRIKFQPDLVAYNSKKDFLILVDYESPNSSDARIPSKDVESYMRWKQKNDLSAPYLIITTLPDSFVSTWEIRYTSPGKTNEGFGFRRQEIRQNPFKFWYSFYRKKLRGMDGEGIFFLNISGKDVTVENPFS